MNGYSLHVDNHIKNNNDSSPYKHDQDVTVHNGVHMEGEDSGSAESLCEHLYTQLAEKERDLELAAGLGNALLEQNEELKKNHELAVEEYNSKLEDLNEEKHKLRLQQTALESEYELTIKELHNDIGQLREELDIERTQSRSGTKNQSQIVEQLMQQNERLTLQLKQAAVTEEQLQGQVDTMRHQVNTRKTSIQEHVQQLQILRDEINLLTERKTEIERRLLVVSEERDVLSSQLDEAQDRSLMLERHNVENQYTLRQQVKELNELREQNESLQQHVDSSISCHSDPDTSLLAELEMSEQPSSIQGPDRVSLAEQLSHHHDNQHDSTFSNHGNITYFGVGFGGSVCVDSDDDIECDDELAMVTSEYCLENIYNEDELPPRHSVQYDNLTDELKQEIGEVYSQLQRLVLQLKGTTDTQHQPDSPIKNGLKAGSLLAVLRELRELTEDIVNRQKLQRCDVSEQDLDILETQVTSLKKELCAAEGQLERLKTELIDRDKQLDKRNLELIELSKQFTLMQVCVQQEAEKQLMTERDRLQDEAAGILTRDDIIQQTREERDKAIERSQQLELELVQSRQDLLSMDTQLIDTIRHKLDLSQQLEQWQCDMADMVSVQVSQKLSQEKKSTKPSPATSTPTKHRPKVKFSLPWS